jgi:hypothetical protein
MATSDAQSQPLGLLARAVGVITSPTPTFKRIVAVPKPVGILFLVCLVLGLAAAGPQFTEAGRRGVLDVQVQQIERFTGQPISPEMYAQLEAGAGRAGYTTFVSMFVFVPFLVVVMTAVSWAIFNIVLGGNATFKDVLNVTSHSQVIWAVGAVVGLPIQLMQGTFEQAGPFNFGALVPMLDASHPLRLFLSALSVFSIWQVIVNGIGLGVLYKRRPGLFIAVLLIIVLAITAFFTVGLSLLLGR